MPKWVKIVCSLTHNGFDFYKIATDVPVNFKLECSAKNIGSTMPGFIFHESSDTGTSSAYSFSLELQILSEGLFAHVGWSTPVDYFGETGKEFINGEWRRFRITMIGTSLTVEFSYDGVNFIQAQDLTVSATIVGDELYIMTGNSFLIDDLSLTELDGAGDFVSDLLNEDFNSYTDLSDILEFDLSAKTNDPISNTW